MQLNTQGSNFVFNLPSDIVPESVQDRYNSMLEKNHILYDNVVDYINSTIKEVSFPGLSFATPEQTRMRGKKVPYKAVTNINDILSVRELQIIFRRVDSDLNYWILFNFLTTNYLDVLNTHTSPLILTSLDQYRDAMVEVKFSDVIFNTLSENIFAYNQSQFSEKTFTITATFTFIDIEYLLEPNKILRLTGEELPVIENRGFNSGLADQAVMVGGRLVRPRA